ncbi:hypothetical protein U27_05435 [Candidatus Vecturithrix granuli]|uniref:Oxaloacetate decarboxylase, gamma chain n=1 Tax=Vecturithrix granuli TaxID=1499967 RepID=A0A081C1K6_VECG1|nr:hypothetical protein U27_05435 [Candidatus Vecturithrix granuli]
MLEGFGGGVIVAIVDFFMVFLVLGGLSAMIMGLERIIAQWERRAAVPSAPPETIPAQKAVAPPEKDQTMTAHIAAISAAIQEYTGLAPGSFKIDTITPYETMPAKTLNPAHIAAISAALYEYASLPKAGSFQITGITHLGNVSSWKMAGRMELMGSEQ